MGITPRHIKSNHFFNSICTHRLKMGLDHRIDLTDFMPRGKGWKRITPGPRTLTMLASYTPSVAVFGAGGLFLGIFFTSSWFGRNVMEKVPIYNKKYDEKDPD